MDLDIYQSSYMIDYKPYGKHKYARVTSEEVRSHSVLPSIQPPTEILFIHFYCECGHWGHLLRTVSEARRSKEVFCVYVCVLFYFFFWPGLGAYGIFPDQERNQCPLQWEGGVLATGSPGKFVCIVFKYTPSRSPIQHLVNKKHLQFK